ncbi:hypothetical protein ENUP19_0064G0021 [Entamoeba nuttalli]
MAITLPPSLAGILPKYQRVVINCTSPEYRELSAQIHMALLPLINTIAILHTPYQSCSEHSFKQFQKDDKTLVVEVGGICEQRNNVYIYPLNIPAIQSIPIDNATIIIVEPSLMEKYSFMKSLNKEYLVVDMKDALIIREKAIKNNINKVVIIYGSETFNSMPFQLYFNPMNIKKINIVNGEEIDCSKETMKYVMNRYSLFDKIRSATTFMLLLLDPDWYNSESFKKLRSLLMKEYHVITVFMGNPENKLLNYSGQVDIAIVLGSDLSELKFEGDIPTVTPYEVLYSLYLNNETEWNGEYPIGIERSKPYIDQAFELIN